MRTSATQNSAEILFDYRLNIDYTTTMRNITKSIASALRNNVRKSNGNTVCTGTSVRLHGNEIARVIDGKLEISLSGWPTVTTRERINGILSEFGCPKRVCQSGGDQYFGDRVISSNEWVKV